jgi:hypothetical protein
MRLPQGSWRRVVVPKPKKGAIAGYPYRAAGYDPSKPPDGEGLVRGCQIGAVMGKTGRGVRVFAREVQEEHRRCCWDEHCAGAAALEPKRSADSVLRTDGERCGRSASTAGRSASAAALEPGRSLGAALRMDGERNREKEPTST